MALRRLHDSVCESAAGSRYGLCTALRRHLENADRALAGGRTQAAGAQLRTYARQLESAGAQRAFAPMERLLLRGNAAALTERLDPRSRSGGES